MAAKREQVIWPHLCDLCSDLEESYSLTAILSAGLLVFFQMTGDRREAAIKAARRFRIPETAATEDLDFATASPQVKNAIIACSVLSDAEKTAVDLQLAAIGELLTVDFVSDSPATRGRKELARTMYEQARKADATVPLDVAIEQVRAANTQYELLSPEKQKWLDDFRAEAIASQRPDTAADRIVADAHRKSAKKKAGRKGTGARKSAKSSRSAG